MRWQRQELVAFSFILLSIGSAVYLATTTLNYLNYYPALGQLTAVVDGVSVVPGSNWTIIDSQISVSNPSAYSGFRIGDAVVSMFFQSANGSAVLFYGSPTNIVQPVGGTLGPHSTVSPVIDTSLSPIMASSFESFYTSHNSKVLANVTLTVQIITFLDPLIGRYSISSMAALPVQG